MKKGTSCQLLIRSKSIAKKFFDYNNDIVFLRIKKKRLATNHTNLDDVDTGDKKIDPKLFFFYVNDKLNNLKNYRWPHQ